MRVFCVSDKQTKSIETHNNINTHEHNKQETYTRQHTNSESTKQAKQAVPSFRPAGRSATTTRARSRSGRAGARYSPVDHWVYISLYVSISISLSRYMCIYRYVCIYIYSQIVLHHIITYYIFSNIQCSSSGFQGKLRSVGPFSI